MEINSYSYQYKNQPLSKNLRMQTEKVKAAFERKGYTPNAYIEKKEYYRVLNSLTAGGQFHEQVANELWAQAAGERPSREIRVNQICMTIVDAQNILQTRISQTNDEIRSLEAEKRKLQGASGQNTLRKIEEIDIRLEQLYGEKESFQDDFRLVTEPFGIQMASSVLRQYAPPSGNYGPQQYGGDSKYMEPHNDISSEGHVESSELRILFYLTMGFGMIELIMIYGKYDFLNVKTMITQLMVFTFTLSIYLMKFFDKIYIRLALALIGISVILDFVWLIMYAGSQWNPPQVGNNSKYQTAYLRFIVFFTIVLLFVKGGIIFILFKYKNITSADKYQVSLGLMKIYLDGNKGNPFSKQLTVLAGQN